MPDKILIPQQKRPFWGFKIRMRWDSCLARSHLTAIPHFAFWALPNRKTAPASARSRNPQDRGFDPSRSKIKQFVGQALPDKILIPQQKSPFWGFKIRMRWDSNPRYARHVRRFSRPLRSTALALIQNLRFFFVTYILFEKKSLVKQFFIEVIVL